MIIKNKIVITTLTLLISFTALAQVQSGTASFYSKKMTGHKTANGERLHHDSLTCAHKTFPFGTLLKVTNPANGQNVIVRVTDRGPYVKGRIIDLSVRAAREIGILAQGIAPVIVERYNQSVIPFKPEDVIDLPELELGANDGPDTKPIWIEIREQRIKKDQETQSSLAMQQSSVRAVPETSVRNPEASVDANAYKTEIKRNKSHDEVIKEINTSPNRSKAYMKRQGGHITSGRQ